MRKLFFLTLSLVPSLSWGVIGLGGSGGLGGFGGGLSIQPPQVRVQPPRTDVRVRAPRPETSINMNVSYRQHYGTRYYHHPYSYYYVDYYSYHHVVYYEPTRHYMRFSTPRDFYTYVYENSPNDLYVHWVFSPSKKENGYSIVNDYPYYSFNGYKHRYSSTDRCNYQLVDSHKHEVIKSSWNERCNRAYDKCAAERDDLNAREGEFKYFCAETFRVRDFDFSTDITEESTVGMNINL